MGVRAKKVAIVIVVLNEFFKMEDLFLHKCALRQKLKPEDIKKVSVLMKKRKPKKGKSRNSEKELQQLKALKEISAGSLYGVER